MAAAAAAARKDWSVRRRGVRTDRRAAAEEDDGRKNSALSHESKKLCQTSCGKSPRNFPAAVVCYSCNSAGRKRRRAAARAEPAEPRRRAGPRNASYIVAIRVSRRSEGRSPGCKVGEVYLARRGACHAGYAAVVARVFGVDHAEPSPVISCLVMPPGREIGARRSGREGLLLVEPAEPHRGAAEALHRAQQRCCLALRTGYLVVGALRRPTCRRHDSLSVLARGRRERAPVRRDCGARDAGADFRGNSWPVDLPPAARSVSPRHDPGLRRSSPRRRVRYDGAVRRVNKLHREKL